MLSVKLELNSRHGTQLRADLSLGVTMLQVLGVLHGYVRYTREIRGGPGIKLYVFSSFLHRIVAHQLRHTLII